MVFSDLFRFRLYGSRGEYERLAMRPCPPYDPDRPIKRWEDPAAKGRSVAYTVWDDESDGLAPLVIAGDVARTVNLPHGLPNEPTSGEFACPLEPVPKGYVLRLGPGGGPALFSVQDEMRAPATKGDIAEIRDAVTEVAKLVTAVTRLVRDLAKSARGKA